MNAIIANLTPFRGIRESGGELFVAEGPGEHQFFSVEVFWRCVQAFACA